MRCGSRSRSRISRIILSQALTLILIWRDFAGVQPRTARSADAGLGGGTWCCATRATRVTIYGVFGDSTPWTARWQVDSLPLVAEIALGGYMLRHCDDVSAFG